MKKIASFVAAIAIACLVVAPALAAVLGRS